MSLADTAVATATEEPFSVNAVPTAVPVYAGASFTELIVTLTVAVSVTPPEVTT